MEYARVSIDDLVGRQVMVHMHAQAFTDLNIQGFQAPRFRAVVLGMDNLGLWIEHPEYKIMPVYDDEGEYIPPGERKEIVHRAAILLLWATIKTIVFFPDMEAVVPTEDVPVIGFSQVREREREIEEERANESAASAKKPGKRAKRTGKSRKK
ncbi:hypothetical protein J7J84_03025 [bacterium]|nr:hypothetical protein [bacterium]